MATVAYVVKSGYAIMANRLNGAGTRPEFVGWGTGASAATVSDTNIQTPDGARVTGTSSVVTTTETNDTYQLVGVITCAGVAKAITEVGVFDAVSSGNMFIHGTFSAVNVDVGESIAFTITTKMVQGA